MRMKGRIEPLRGATVHRQGGDVFDLSDDVGSSLDEWEQ